MSMNLKNKQPQDLSERVGIRQKQKTFNRLIYSISGLWIVTSLLIILVSLLSLSDQEIGPLITEKLSWLSPVTNFVNSNIISRPDTEIFLQVILYIGFVIIPPVVTAFLLKLICIATMSLPKNKNNDTDLDLKNLEDKEKALTEKIYRDTSSFGNFWALILNIASLGFFIWEAIVTNDFSKEPVETLLGAVIYAVVMYFLLGFVFYLLFTVIPHFRLTKEEAEEKRKIIKEKNEKMKEEAKREKEKKDRIRRAENKSKYGCRACKYYDKNPDVPWAVCLLHKFHFENDFSPCEDFESDH